MQLGFTIDIARKYYTPKDLYLLIDMLADSQYSFLQMHISDNENYGIESALLNQTTSNAFLVDDAYICKATGKAFLSVRQLEHVLAYAKEKNIEVIPEIDSPAHMGGIWNLLDNNDDRSVCEQLRVSSSNEINMSHLLAVPFITALYSEVLSIFGGGERIRHFHIGGDEFGGAESPEYMDFIPYANALIRWLNQRGITARLWNDGLTQWNVSKFRGNFEVTYWTSGKKGRCTMQELMDAGISVFNYNRYYLYFVPREKHVDERFLIADMKKAASDIEQIWHPGIWDSDHTETGISPGGLLLGASIVLWGENSEHLHSGKLIQSCSYLIEGLAKRLTE